MHKIALITKREYSTRVRQSSFWVMTLLTPCLLLGLAYLPHFFETLNSLPSTTLVSGSAFTEELSHFGHHSEEHLQGLSVVLGMGFSVVLYVFVLSYGAMVMRAVLEEKNNRMLEIMLASVRPFQLMMGKIVGVLLLGLTQMTIWLLLLLMIGQLCTYGEALPIDEHAPDRAAQWLMADPHPNAGLDGILFVLPNWGELFIAFLLYFLGGYLVFAAFFAAVGAVVHHNEDASQFVSPVVLVLLVGMYAAMACTHSPESKFSFWASLFPLTSPMVMMARLPFGVPWWELAVSWMLLFATAVGMVWIAAKIYHRGILYQGKKATYQTLWRWLKGGE